MLQEEWKDIDGYEGVYQISNYGRVKSLSRYVNNHGTLTKKKENYLSYHFYESNYLHVNLSLDRKLKIHKVHRLVAAAFIPIVAGKLHINHKDCNSLNNHYSNLEWVTVQENNTHALINNLHPNSPLNENLVTDICEKYITGEFTQGMLADEFKVSKNVIRSLVNKRTWKHITAKYNFPDRLTYLLPEKRPQLHMTAAELIGWVPIDKESKYFATPAGYIKNSSGYILTPFFKKDKGGALVRLSYNGKKTERSVALIIAQLFLPNTCNGVYAIHKDGNKLNNAVDNLEWINDRGVMGNKA